MVLVDFIFVADASGRVEGARGSAGNGVCSQLEVFNHVSSRAVLEQPKSASPLRFTVQKLLALGTDYGTQHSRRVAPMLPP